MFNRTDLVKISGLSGNQIVRLDELGILLPKLNGIGVEAEYTYNDLIFTCVYAIIRQVLKQLGFGLHELNDKFKGGLGSEIDFVNSDIFFFTRAAFFVVPSSSEARAVFAEWIGDKSFDILPNVTSKHLKMFGLDVLGGILLNALILNLHKLRLDIKVKAEKLGIAHKIPTQPELKRERELAIASKNTK